MVWLLLFEGLLEKCFIHKLLLDQTFEYTLTESQGLHTIVVDSLWRDCEDLLLVPSWLLFYFTLFDYEIYLMLRGINGGVIL